MIRHCVEKDNVDENFFVIDPDKVRHVVVIGGRIKSMSGFIDPLSHLNLDFPDHKVTECIIADEFVVGAKVLIDNRGLVFATVLPSYYKHYGFVDYTQRFTDMVEAVKKYQNNLKTQIQEKCKE